MSNNSSHRLDNVLKAGSPVYGCHNKTRPTNGAPVVQISGTDKGEIVAATHWNGSSVGEAVPCFYKYEHQNDPLCNGCEHKK